MLTNLFRNIAVSRQQIRFLPRFSQSWPEKHEIPQSTCVDESNTNETIKETVPEQTFKEASTYSKINWRRPSSHHPASLVIRSAQEKQPSKSEKRQNVTKKLKKGAAEEANDPTIDDQGNLIYTKMGNNDIRISQIMANVKTRKENHLMLLEGKRLIREALETGCKLEYILFSRVKDVESIKPYLPKLGKLYKMPYKEMQSWSDLITNPGIMGIFQIPPSNFFEPKEAIPLTIICDNIREPSNIGAILRTSSGVGCEQVVLTKGCVNVWETKVLRSACGAHFRVKMSKKANWDDTRSLIPKDASVFIADNKTISSSDSVNSTENLAASVPVLPYFSVNFKLSNHIVLIIGGETEGISVESYKLAQEFNGVRLNVPLSNGIDSLNTGTALGIIAFEIKRQLMSLRASEEVGLKY